MTERGRAPTRPAPPAAAGGRGALLPAACPRPTPRGRWPAQRVLEVLALLADGLRNADIAARLSVSEKTVDHHVSAVLRKLPARTPGAAGAKAARLGILER